MRKYGVACVAVISGAVGCGGFLAAPFDDADEHPRHGGSDASDLLDAVEVDGNLGTSGTDSGAARPRVVFVTRQTTPGNFGGLNGGDSLCTAEATDAGIGGAFVAWLSVAGKKPLDAIDRLSDVDGGWSLVDGGQVFASKGAIAASASPARGIVQTAYGETVSGHAWTGTRPGGTAESADCQGWMTAKVDTTGVEGIVGAQDGTWTSAASDYCANANHLICFEN